MHLCSSTLLRKRSGNLSKNSPQTWLMLKKRIERLRTFGRRIGNMSTFILFIWIRKSLCLKYSLNNFQSCHPCNKIKDKTNLLLSKTTTFTKMLKTSLCASNAINKIKPTTKSIWQSCVRPSKNIKWNPKIQQRQFVALLSTTFWPLSTQSRGECSIFMTVVQICSRKKMLFLTSNRWIS